MIEMKNLLEGLNHRFEQAEERIRIAEDKSTEIFQSEEKEWRQRSRRGKKCLTKI